METTDSMSVIRNEAGNLGSFTFTSPEGGGGKRKNERDQLCNIIAQSEEDGGLHTN